jgi:hypothetical protein
MFENLEEYYDYLEKDTSLIRNYSIANKLNSIIEKTKDATDKKVLSYEMFFNDLNFEKGILIPKHSIGQKSYPELSLFDDDFEYIKSRATSEKVLNFRNKAKYNHIIWESPKKHIEYAKRAIDNYFALLEKISLPIDDNLTNRGFTLIYENLFILSEAVNYKKREIIGFLTSHLNKDELNGHQKYSLIDFIVSKGKKVNKEYVEDFFNYSRSVIDNDLYPEFSKEYLNLLIFICSKKGITAQKYHNKLGDFHILDSEKHKENFAVHDYYLKAIKQYQKAGNKEKVEKVTVLIEKAKDNLNFKSIKSEHSSPELQKWWDNLKAYTTELIDNGESKDVYEYLILAKIFPKANMLDKKVKTVMMDLFSTINFDINRNVSGSENNGINSYNLYIQNFTLGHLWLIFTKGMKDQKIGIESLKDYFENHTWYGEDIITTNADGVKETFNWLDLLMPSFANYFIQSEIDLKKNENSETGYILSIDSLVLKFEGVLRSFSRNIGAQTIDIKENGTQERISFEKLLKNEKIKDIIPEDDIVFFKFIFTSEGMNLRNNIAHCFYKPKNYSAAVMWLLACAFLRLGNYKFNNIEK